MRKSRTIYFNDARHYYLFVFDPPMRLEDAWRPVDEVSGTAVDTFIYGVSRGDTGLFFPSEVGMRFGADLQPFQNAYEWRSWENMGSLIARGLDPLTVLIDRAHEKNMEFFASLRLGSYGGMNPEHSVANGGRGFLHPEVRDHQYAQLVELATRYAVDGVELDFAAAPGGDTFCLSPEDAPQEVSVLTNFVRDVAAMVRQRPGNPGQVGVRVYPAQELNERAGLEVDTWLREGLVDFVVPMAYSCFVLDANMPIDWIVAAAHEKEIPVYGMLQPYYDNGQRSNTKVVHATPAMMRAAAANFWHAGVDGLYTWFMPWPLGEPERLILSEIGDPDLVQEGDKHYFLRRRAENPGRFDYQAHLPLEIPTADPQKRYEIPFTVADNSANDRIQHARLKLNITNLVTLDHLEVSLNGNLLPATTCRYDMRPYDTYTGQWLTFDLAGMSLQQGANILAIALSGRPTGFTGSVVVEDVEIIIEYGVFAAVSR
ncbi:MAG: hypothetical protein OSA97_14590 [Nevskia sp.]|nr:hypothetical protein [Nevskia sp.]